MATYVELHVENFEKTQKFYELLEFEVVWSREPERKKGYLVMRNGDNVLMFWCGNEFVYEQNFFKQYPRETPRGKGVEIVLMFQDVVAYFDRIKLAVDIVEPLKVRPWGISDFRVVDPEGFYLRLSGAYDVYDSSHAIE
jgi:uncharacterized glyoxalase superfamily protein PhnB